MAAYICRVGWWMVMGLLYLDRVLKFWILVVKHTEAQWFFRNNFYQHQVAALQNTQRNCFAFTMHMQAYI